MDRTNFIEPWRELIDVALAAACSRFLPEHEDIGAAVRYSLLGKGKRLRGLLLLAVAHDVGVYIEKTSELFDIAVALEALHAASLIHDDLPALDNDDLRRGAPACHRAFSEATAILAGDALVGLAFAVVNHSVLKDEKKVLVSRAISSAWIRLCRGQVLDLQTAGKAVSPEVMELKTGALFSAAVECGAAMSVTREAVLSAWSSWGLEIGKLFQQFDDLLDGEGGAREFLQAQAALQARILYLRKELLKLSDEQRASCTEEVLSMFIPQELPHVLRPAV